MIDSAQVTFANDPSVVLKLKSFLNSIASGLLETNSVINEKESSTDSMLQRFSFSPEFTLLYLFLNQTDENHGTQEYQFVSTYINYNAHNDFCYDSDNKY